MKLKDLQTNWHKFGQTDPLWSILSLPNRLGNKWDVDEFFATGEIEVQNLLAYLESLDLSLPKGVALDFGCGIGRITQPLSTHFDLCYGVDIAPSMIELAKKHNRYPNKCRYILNENDDLRFFEDNSIDFIYCVITLQNIAPRYSKKYIKEFMRILAPHKLLIFQIPSEPKTFRQAIKQYLPEPILDLYYKLKYRGRPIMKMHGVKKETVIRLLEENGAKILDSKPDKRAFQQWTSFQYCVTKE